MGVSGNTFDLPGKFIAAGKLYEGKVTIVMAADSMSFTIRAEISTDGKTWTPFAEAKYTKVSPAAKE